MQHLIHNLLRTPGLAYVVVEMGNVMAWLIAVGILAYQTGNIHRGRFTFQLGIGREQRIQLADEGVASSHQFHQSVHIVGNEPSPLPCRTFAIVIITVIGSAGVERRTPVALTVQSAHEAGTRIEINFISLGKSRILIAVGFVVQSTCQYGDTPVIVSIFQSFSHRFIVFIARHVANLVLPVLGLRHQMRHNQRMGDNTRRIVFCRTEASLVSLLHVEVTVSLYIRIRYEGGCMITNHGTRIVSGQFPHRQDAALAGLLDERTDESLVQFRINNRHQRMIGTESVP